MLKYRKATFDDVEHIHKLINDYAKEGLMLSRSRNSIYENLRDYLIAEGTAWQRSALWPWTRP